MSEYIYPTLLQPQFVHADVEPVIRQGLGAVERDFSGIPAICEMFIQRMGEGALDAGNPFEAALGGNIYRGRGYNSQDLDASLYTFKKEFDSVLVSEGKLNFNVPQLSDILAREIEFVRAEGLPFLQSDLSEEDIEKFLSDAEKLFGSFLSHRKPLMGGFGGFADSQNVADVKHAMEVIGSVAPRNMSADGPWGDDSLLNILQQLTPFLKIAIQVVVEIGILIANIIQAAIMGVGTVAGAVSASMTTLAALGTAFLAAIPTFIASAAVAGMLYGAMMIGVGFYVEYLQWKKYVKELRKQRSAIQEAFEQLASETRKEIKAFKASCDRSALHFKLVMSEMIARVLDGEFVVGFLSKDCGGRFVLNFSVDPEYKKPETTYVVENDQDAKIKAIAIGAAAGAALLVLR